MRNKTLSGCSQPLTGLAALCLFLQAAGAASGLEVALIGKVFKPDPQKVLIQQTEANMGGNTSVRATDKAHLEWKTQGYYQRNRDLGQVFTPERNMRMDSIVLRTGPGDGAVLHGTPGAKVFVQGVFE